MSREGGSDTEAYIRELFRHVLRQDSPDEEQVKAWTARAGVEGDPIAIFRAIAALPAHLQQLAIDRECGTRWPAGHFYSPVVNRREVQQERSRIFARRSQVGVDLRAASQQRLFAELARHFPTAPFADHKGGRLRYHYDNPSYNFGDAVVYWAMLNRLRPRRIVEIGSGFSSALALDAIDILGLPTVCTFIDPFPEVVRQATEPLDPRHRIVPSRVQDTDLGEFAALTAGDLLFIDSSHVLKTGSDVHFELTEILPRLQPGVIVHFHDVFANFEYPEQWVLDANHSWNEQYALHAFLLFNGAFRIEYFNHWFATTYPQEIRTRCPGQAERILLNPGGGLWLERNPA
jgi:SAM-dependent methyltransferase